MTVLRIDAEALQQDLLGLLRTSTEVPIGETEVQPGDPRIRAAVDDVIGPMLEALGPDEVRRHDAGDVAFRFGPASEDGLLLQTYVVSQHGNLMDDPLGARLVDGADVGLEGPCAVGQGASQNKGPMAAVVAAMRAVDIGSLGQPVWVALNTEGKSSHGGSQRLLDELGVKAAAAVVAIGTDLRVSLGNRGRLDVHLAIPGSSAHSSQPWLAENPIERVGALVEALASSPVPARHASLGPATITPYQLRCEPVAPHTIPERVTMVVDRRLLPGEAPAKALEALSQHVWTSAGSDIEVTQGASMRPVEVSAGEPVVKALLEGAALAGRDAQTFVSQNAFDAGYAASLGIPTPMFGPGRRHFAGSGLVGAEAVALRDCADAAVAYAHAIDALCASPSIGGPP